MSNSQLNLISIETPSVSPSSLTYNEISTLKKPLSGDNCKNYGVLLRSDCLTVCMLIKLFDEHGDNANIFMDKLVREEHFNKLDKIKSISNPVPTATLKIEQACYKECPQDCRQTYYLTDTKDRTRVDIMQSQSLSRESMFYIQHNQMPDLFIRHIPEMTFISFVCDSGGLLGMWLGFSALGTFTLLIRVLAAIEKKKSNLLFIINMNLNINSRIGSVERLQIM